MPCSPVYEFHDINVKNFANIANFLNNFGSKIKWNLMVIPFCEEEKQEDIAAFKEQLQLWKAHGYLLHLHGYKHKANPKLERSLFGALALRLTNGEAEFAGLGDEASRELLVAALSAWQILDAEEPAGFVAPAWYGSRALFKHCKKMGMQNYGSRFIMWNKRTGSHLSVPFSTAGIPKILIPIINVCEKIYLKLYSIFNFLPIPRIVKHPIF